MTKRAAHREERRAYDAAYYAAHQEERRAYNAAHREERLAYNAAHQEERRAYNAAYDAKHREERRAYRRAYDATYYATHREERRAYYAAHREERRASGAAWRAKHRDDQRAYDTAYRATHLDERRDQVHRRRARKRCKTAEPIQRGFLALLFDAQAHTCWYCPAPLVWSAGTRDPGHKHLEHRIPLARINGVHAPWNLCWSCAPCNLRKHAMTEAEFLGPGDLYQDWPEPDGP